MASMVRDDGTTQVLVQIEDVTPLEGKCTSSKGIKDPSYFIS